LLVRCREPRRAWTKMNFAGIWRFVRISCCKIHSFRVFFSRQGDVHA
jgi:hypothetical protein